MTTAVATKKATYSHSRLTKYERCERAFFHKYIEKRPEPSGMPAVSGKIFHTAIEQVLNNGFIPEDAVSYAIYEENGLPEGESFEGMVYMVKRAFYRVQQFNSEFADVLSELHLEVETEKAKLQGFLDVVVDDPANDVVEINDFKTSWQPFPADTSKQLKLYGWMYKQMRGGIVADKFIGRLIFPRRSDFADSEIVFTDEDLEEAYQWAVNLIDEIEAKDPYNMQDWETTSDRNVCQYCPFVAICSGGFVQGVPSNGEPKDELEAAAIAEYIRMQELLLKKMKDGLKKHVKENGPVSLPGGKWEFSQSDPSPKVPFSVVKQYAENHNLEMEEIFSIDNKTLKRWIEEDSTGYLGSQAKWTSPRKSFKFLEEANPSKEQ